jgi:hypothetical protein
MEVIQVAISNSPYAVALREVLVRSGNWEVECVEAPDLTRDGVMVLDCDHLSRLPLPLVNPERVVLLARRDAHSLSRAWDAGVNSVIFDRDPLNTAVLAVMAARLRVAKARRAVSSATCSGCGAALPATGGRRTAKGLPEAPGRIRISAGRQGGRNES